MRLAVVYLLLVVVSSANAYQNVFGGELKSCSSDGMALTGYTRNGYCVDQNDDSGSHHICIDMSSTVGGNFCDVTGQSDWCDGEMPCHQDANKYCQVKNWCVCQWAFASYINNAGGCNKIQDIVCESINLEALLAYKSNPSYSTALQCLIDRCGLDLNNTQLRSYNSSLGDFGWILGLSVVGLLFGGILIRQSRFRRASLEASLIQPKT